MPDAIKEENDSENSDEIQVVAVDKSQVSQNQKDRLVKSNFDTVIEKDELHDTSQTLVENSE